MQIILGRHVWTLALACGLLGGGDLVSRAGLVASWNLNEAASGEVAAYQIKDSGTNEFHSINLNAWGCKWVYWNGPTRTNSDGIAVQLDSVNSGDICFGTGDNNELIITNSLSVFLRVQYHGGTAYESFTGRRGSSTDASTENSWALYTDPAHNLRFDLHSGTSVVDVYGPVLTVGEYYDIAAVYDSAAQKAYLYTNGVLAASNLAVGFSSINAATNTTLYLGYGGAGLYDAAPGTQFEQARIFDNALSGSDVAALSGIGVSPLNHAAPVAFWNLDEAFTNVVTAGQIQDSGANSLNSINMTAVGCNWVYWGGPLLSTSDGIAVQFDGTGGIGFGTGAGNELIITNSLSVFIRFQYDGGTYYNALAGRRGGGTDANTNNSWALYTDPDHHLRFDLHNGTSLVDLYGSVLTVGQYYDVAAVFDAAAQKAFLYVNNVLDCSNSSVGFSSINVSPGVPFFIGAASAAFSPAATGTLIERVGIYDRALNTNELAVLSAALDCRQARIDWWDAYHAKMIGEPDQVWKGFYSSAPMAIPLSGWLTETNEIWKQDAERQLIYAMAQTNVDGFALALDPNSNYQTNYPYLTRDSLARDGIFVYAAYKTLGNPDYLAWVDQLATAMATKLQRSNFSYGGRNYNIFFAQYQPAPPYSPYGSLAIDPNQNAEVGLLFTMLYNEPNSVHYNESISKQIATNELNASVALQTQTGELSLDSNAIGSYDTGYGSYAIFCWALANNYWQSLTYQTNIDLGAFWLSGWMNSDHLAEHYYPSYSFNAPWNSEMWWRLGIYYDGGINSSNFVNFVYNPLLMDPSQIVLLSLANIPSSLYLNYVESPPMASFTSNLTNGSSPLTVTFNDTSTGTINNRFWDFGDGAITNITNSVINHTYAAGSYTVTLIVSGPSGTSTNTKSSYVTAWTPFQSWQMQYFGTTSGALAGAYADFDGDGMSNTNEFLAGTNPTNGASVLRMTQVIRNSNNTYTIKWQSVGGKRYRVQFSGSDTNVGFNGSFIDIVQSAGAETDTNSVGVKGTMSFTDDFTLTPVVTSNRFYRVRLY